MLAKDRRGKVVLHAERDNSGLYVAEEEDVSETSAVMTDNPGKLKGVASRAKGVSYGLEGVVTHDLTQVSIEEAFGKTDLKMSGADSSKFVYDHHADEERKRVIESMNLHCAQGHPSQQVLCDAVENGAIAGCHLTRADRADISLAFRPLSGRNACLKGKLKLPLELESKHAPAPDVGHTLFTDIVFGKKIDAGKEELGLDDGG